MSTIEKLLPQNIEAEKGVLGSILLDPMVYDLISDRLSSVDFYRNAHRTLFETIVSLAAKRVPPDYIAICDDLERLDKLEEVGGASYIASLYENVVTSGRVGYYADMVARTALLRRLIHAAGRIAALGYEQDPEALQQSMELLYEIDQRTALQSFCGMPELVTTYMDRLYFLHEHKHTLPGIPTGYEDIDVTLGGLQKTDLILLGGRSSSGKTSLGLCMGYNAALRGHHTAIFSLEMGKLQLMQRLMAIATHVDLQRLRLGWVDDDEWESIINQAGNLSGLPIWINDTAGSPISSMRSHLRRLVQEQGHIDLVIVDYLGLIDPEEKTENQVQAISKISKGLKALAREFNVPVLALAQLSREVERRQNKHPMLSDLRDSGSLEQDADVVLLVYRDAYYAQQEGRPVKEGHENIAEISVAKHRNGPTGDINLFFQKEHAAFYSLDAKKGEAYGR